MKKLPWILVLASLIALSLALLTGCPPDLPFASPTPDTSSDPTPTPAPSSEPTPTPTSTPTPTPNPAADAFVSDGLVKLADKDFSGAMTSFTAAIAADPNNTKGKIWYSSCPLPRFPPTPP